MIKSVSYHDESGVLRRVKCSTESAKRIGALSDIEAIKRISYKTFDKFKNKKSKCAVYRMSNNKYFVHIAAADEEEIVLIPDDKELFLILSDYLTAEGYDTLDKEQKLNTSEVTMDNDFFDFVDAVCKILKIEPPKIVFDDSKFQTPTTLAQVSSDGSTAYFRQGAHLTRDLALATAHELRHVWQIKNNRDFYLENYNPDRTDNAAYNSQPAEIDAHAFSKIIMTEFFGIAPTFEFLPKEIRQAIDERISFVLKSLKK